MQNFMVTFQSLQITYRRVLLQSLTVQTRNARTKQIPLWSGGNVAYCRAQLQVSNMQPELRVASGF